MNFDGCLYKLVSTFDYNIIAYNILKKARKNGRSASKAIAGIIGVYRTLGGPIKDSEKVQGRELQRNSKEDDEMLASCVRVNQ